MLAYAANAPKAATRSGSPKALTLVIVGHAALLAAVLAAKPELVGFQPDTPQTIFDVPIDPPPQPPEPVEITKPDPQTSFIEKVRTIVPMDQTIATTPIDQGPSSQGLDPVIGTGIAISADPPRAEPVRTGPHFATAESSVRPPYPLDMRRAEQEATLKLRLTIDARGRVTAVEPVGTANPSFLEAARKHILRSWRYKPATENGVAVPSTTVISLSFRLEEA
jgi:periplasmic protein TonB